MKGFSGEAGPRKGADQTVAGLCRRASHRVVLRAAESQEKRTGMKRGGAHGTEPDSGGWQRCRPPFRMGAFLRGILRHRSLHRRRRACFIPLYFGICDDRHTVVKSRCLIGRCDPETFRLRNRSPFSRPRSDGPAGNLSIPFGIVCPSPTRAFAAAERSNWGRRQSGLWPVQGRDIL